jgi:hypothetical protein
VSYERLVQLFERIHHFIQRLDRYTGTPLPPDMIDLLGKIMAHVLSVLTHSTRAIKESRTSRTIHSICSSLADYDPEKFLMRLIGRTDVEDALERLDMLTKEENLTTAARSLEVIHRVEDNVKENMKLNHHIVHNVTAVQEDVSNIKDSVTLTKHGAQTPLNEFAWTLTDLSSPSPSHRRNTGFVCFSSSHCPSSTLRRSQGINYGKN